jgi:hypothetical protein
MGVVEDIKGKAKVIGEVTGDDSKEHGDRAQQDRAQTQRDVAGRPRPARLDRRQRRRSGRRAHQDS